MTKARDLSKLADGTEFTAADHSKLDGIEASATADQTSAQIKAAVEAASDSNVFTDADHSKLNGVATGATDNTVASAALPKAGGALTGAITTNSTFDGVDIATRDAVLTATTATANAALPKSGGAVTGNLIIQNSGGTLQTATAAGVTHFRAGPGAGASVDANGGYGVTIGKGAGTALSSGAGAVAIGYEALETEDTRAEVVAVGFRALRNQNAGAASNNAAFGYGAAEQLTTAVRCTFIGTKSGHTGVVTGNSNTGLGFETLQDVTDGVSNLAAGSEAGYTLVGGDYNAYLGSASGYSNNGSNNTFVGFASGYLSTGSRNTFVGARNGTHGSGQLMTSGDKNTILGGFDGNQNSLDIRAADNHVVLSDGDGNPVFVNIPNNTIQTGGRYSVQDQLYQGAATGWDSNASINTWTTVTAVDFNDGLFDVEGVITVIVFTNSLNASYGYYSRSQAEFASVASNTGYHGANTVYTTNGTKVGELQVVSSTHTQATALDFRMRLASISGVGKRLQVYSNVAPSGSTAAPSMAIAINKTQRF
jgi:hypothetical protein